MCLLRKLTCGFHSMSSISMAAVSWWSPWWPPPPFTCTSWTANMLKKNPPTNLLKIRQWHWDTIGEKRTPQICSWRWQRTYGPRHFHRYRKNVLITRMCVLFSFVEPDPHWFWSAHTEHTEERTVAKFYKNLCKIPSPPPYMELRCSNEEQQLKKPATNVLKFRQTNDTGIRKEAKDRHTFPDAEKRHTRHNSQVLITR